MHYITISIFIVLFSVSSLAQTTFKNGIISSSSSNKSKINTDLNTAQKIFASASFIIFLLPMILGIKPYNVGSSGSGNTRGSGMADTRLNGSGNYQTRQINTDDYRAQEFPDGTATTIATYYLRINKS